VADPDVEPEHVTESLAGPEVEVRPEPSPVSVASPAPAPLALTTDEPADDGSPVLDQLDKLLDRLVSERVSTADELAGHRRQLDELADEKARLEKSLRSVEDKVRSTGETIQSLEAQLAREDELLESMRTKLAGLTRSADRA
jgi:phage shock protein A